MGMEAEYRPVGQVRLRTLHLLRRAWFFLL